MTIDWSRLRGREFYKMCGSGNDFVFFDTTAHPAGLLASDEAIRTLCARATGVGADGVVFLEPPRDPSGATAFRMRYHNSDGSRASMCGNAALCTSRLAVELGIVDPVGFRFETDAGVVAARIRDGEPEIDLAPISGLRLDAPVGRSEGEQRIGFATAGVPHLVVRVPNVEEVALAERGRELRHHPTLEFGANVNFVAPASGGWRMRTYERGVEGETLACGTGAIACAAVLSGWGDASPAEVVILTSSGRPLTVRLPESHDRGPSLRGEGRLVYRGVLEALA